MFSSKTSSINMGISYIKSRYTVLKYSYSHFYTTAMVEDETEILYTVPYLAKAFEQILH